MQINDIDLKKLSSETLCANVVIYRSLKINQDLAERSMSELQLREKNGDNFNYNEFINKELENMPKNDIDLKDIGKIIENEIK